ncbi:Ig-like domain-containing protein [Pseudactinotalea suaedae]|uniref:Ig-like domain-containing protein n=1 Tax=Pseudactinotalea suaedae TaxID=1524924 RepID=UPI0012E29ADC|nr:invasin domain 3-containing protein [Pseudactinotalea suaedae]
MSSALLVVVGLIASVPPAAAADATVTTGAELVEAFDCDGADTCTVTADADIVSSQGPAVAEGRTVTLDLAGHQVTISSQRDHAGIAVPPGAALVIEDSVGGAVLTTTGGAFGAGIGGDYLESAGAITINGGEVTAVGGGLAAGIGGGQEGGGGDVMIGSGAAVTASGASATSVAIGPGSGGSGLGSLSNAGTVTIPAASYISIPEGVTVTNSGTLTGGGRLDNDGAIANTGIVDVDTLAVTGRHYLVSFDANGGDGAPEPLRLFAPTLEAGALTLPATAPTRPGHGFTGWFTSASGTGQPVTEQTVIGTGSATNAPLSVTLFAGWEELPGSQTSVTSGVNPARETDTVTLTATVDPVPDGGTVAFLDRDSAIEGCDAVPVDASGTATCTPDLDAGRYVVTAEFSGTDAVAASVSGRLLQVVYPTVAGHVAAWGANVHDGGYEVPAPDPAGQIDVPEGLDDVIAVAAGTDHSLALTASGTVVGWGGNRAGETDIPSGLSDVVAIDAGAQYSLALQADGTVVAWGRNVNGETDVPGDLTDVVAIAAGDFHAVALRSDGSVVVWGLNNQGQHAVPDDLFATTISAGTFHTYALTPSGTVAGWGGFSWGQLSPPGGLGEVTQIEAGGVWSLALTGGSLVAWGGDGRGETDVPDLSDAVEVSAGWYHGVARTGDGTILAWGDNSAAQLEVPSDLSRVVALSAGGAHTLALMSTPPVININTTTTVESSANPSMADEAVTFTADVAPNPGGGTVNFSDGSTTLCADVPVDPASGEATCTQTFTSGSHSITAAFSGSGQYLASTSAPLTQVVNAPVEAPTITTTTLPDGTVGSASIANLAASGGAVPYTWSLSGGDLPPGLQLSSSSIIGIPSAAGTWTFTVTVTDANLQTDSQELSMTIAPAGVSLDVSTVTAAPTSVIADGASTSTVTVTVRNTVGQPMAGKTVALQLSGSAIAQPASGPSDSAGVVTFLVTDTVAEQVTITATVDGAALTYSTDVTFTAGPVAAAGSTVTATPTEVPADGETASTITVTLRDANGNPVAGESATLAAGGGSSVISEASGPSDADGVVTFTVTSTVAEQVTYAATAGGTQIDQTAAVTFTVGSVSRIASTVVASPTTVTADGESTSTITVTLRDATGNAIPGQAVTLAASSGSSTISEPSGSSGADGMVSFSVTNTVAEQVTYAATAGGTQIDQTAAVTFTAGSVSPIASTVVASPTSVTADGESTSTITVTLRDATGNAIPGQAVTLAATSGSSTISEPSGSSGADGMVSFSVTNTVAEQVTYTATAGDTALTQTAQVQFTAGAVSPTASSVTANPTSVTADGESAATITVTLLDANDNPVPGLSVTLAAGGGSSVISEPSGPSDADGVVTFTVTDTVAEQVTYTATAGGTEIDDSAAVTFTVGEVSVSGSTLTAEPTTVVADGQSISSITAVIVDAQGNPVPGQVVTLVADGGSSVIAPPTAITGSDGRVVFSVTSTVAEQVTYGATVSPAVVPLLIQALAADDLTLDATTTVTFVAGAVSATESTLTADPTTVAADGVAASTITVTLRDAQGNAVAGEEVSLTADGGSSQISASSGPSDGDGIVTFTVTDDVAEQVSYTAVAGSTELATPVLVTFVSVPTAPLDLVASAGDGSVDLTWSPPADDGQSPVLGYLVYRSTEPGLLGTALTGEPLDATSFTDSDVTNRTTYVYTVIAVNAVGESAPAQPAEATPFAPLAVSTDALPSGTVGVAYRAQLEATGGLDSDYTWALAVGDLPPGLTLSTDGTISGTPTSAGTYTFTVTVNDPVPAELVIVIDPADVPPVDETPTDGSPTDSSSSPTDGSAGDGTNLPTTGIGTAGALLAGLVLLAGLALVLVSRRRRGL